MGHSISISPPGRVAVVVLILCAIPGVAPAQGSVTIPKDATYEGTSYSSNLGGYAEGRFQYVYGALKGKKHTLKDVFYRVDYRDHNRGLSSSRSWSKVTLAVSETTNYKLLSPTFSVNVTGSASVVFNAKASWPTQSGLPITYPGLWGGLGGKLRFAFNSPFKYTGTNDLMLDYTFQGGQLGNGGSWGGQFPALRHYVLDGEAVSGSLVNGLARSIPQTGAICTDSYWSGSATTPALAEGRSWVSGATGSTVWVQYRTIVTAPDAPVIHAVGLGGSIPGIDLGAKCNRLHVDLRKPWVAAFLKTGPPRSAAATPWTRHTGTWAASMSRLTLYIQGAWTDSKSGAFALTRALEMVLPGGPPPSQLPRQKTLYARSASATRAEVIPFYSAHNPYVRFTTQ